MVDPASPFPELVKLIKHSFDELQSTLTEREKSLARERDELKKQVDFLESNHGYKELEKCDLEEKLGRSRRRCEELDGMIVQMKEKFEKSRGGKLDVGEEVVRKCQEMDERVVRMGKEIEGLNKTIEALKAKEIEADGVVRELKRRSVEAVLAIDELRAKRREFDKAAQCNATMEDCEGEEPGVRVTKRRLDSSVKRTRGSASFKDIDKPSSSKDTSKTGQRDDKGKGKLNETECAPLRPRVMTRAFLAQERIKQKHDKEVTIKDTPGRGVVPKRKHAASTSRTSHDLERGKHVAEESDSGSDIANRAAKRMKYKKTEIQPKRVYPRLIVRSSPRCLYDAVRKLNSRQKQAVKEMGFGHLLNLNISMLPGRLAYWLVNNFNSKSCELTMPNGRTLTVTEEDVRRVLGFPNGHRKIVLVKGQETTKLYKQWKALFSDGNIWMHDLVGAMLRCRNGGSWFKRHFMILVSTSFIESHSSGRIFPFIIRCLENLEDIKKWNWAEYVMNSLVKNKRTWAKARGRGKMFFGPALFLVVFYVDRLAVYNKTIERSFPLLSNWTYESLKDREEEEIEGGFGVGQIREPIILPKEMNVQEEDVPTSVEDVDCKDGLLS